MIEKFVQMGEDLVNSNLLWRGMLLIVVALMVRGAYKIQRARDNNFDFLDMLRDLKTNRASRVGFFYMMGAISSTVVYIYACTRPGVTVSEINIFTITYGGLFIGSQGWNKQIERPPDPERLIERERIRDVPQTQVNVNPPPQEPPP